MIEKLVGICLIPIDGFHVLRVGDIFRCTANGVTTPLLVAKNEPLVLNAPEGHGSKYCEMQCTFADDIGGRTPFQPAASFLH